MGLFDVVAVQNSSHDSFRPVLIDVSFVCEVSCGGVDNLPVVVD